MNSLCKQTLLLNRISSQDLVVIKQKINVDLINLPYQQTFYFNKLFNNIQKKYSLYYSHSQPTIPNGVHHKDRKSNLIHQTVDCNAVTRLLYCIIYQLLFSAESLCLLFLFLYGGDR